MTDDLHEMAEELEDAAELEGSELGEWWSALAGLVPRVFDSASERFKAAFEKELRREHKRFKKEFRIKERIDTEGRDVVIRELQHESEWDD